MTPEQAINLLEAAAKTYKGTLEDHVNLQNAVKLLRDTIKETDNGKSPDSQAKDGRTGKATK